jgi:uncharacterized protein involved in outer membrane biogenesis
MRCLRKIVRSKLFIIIPAACIVAYTLSGFFLAPHLIRHFVPKIVQDQFRTQAGIDEVRFNPYLFTLEVNGFRLDEPNGQLIAGLQRLFVDFELKSLFKWAWTFRQVRIEGVRVNAVIERDGTLNLSKLAPPSDAPLGEAPDEHPPRVIFEEILIEKGQVDFSDRTLTPPASVKIDPLHIQVKNLTTLPEQEGQTTISAAGTDGETLRWTGSIGLNPVAAKGSFTIENLKTATVWEFARDALNLERPEGRLTLSADCGIGFKGGKPQMAVENLSLALSALSLRLQGSRVSLLKLPDMRISGGSFDLAGRQMGIEKITIKGGRTDLSVDEDETFNLQRMVKANETTPPSVAEPAEQGSQSRPWKIKLAAFDVEKFAVDLQNLSRQPGMRAGIDELSVGLKAEAEFGARTRVQIDDIRVGVSGFQSGLSDSTDPILRFHTIDLTDGGYDPAANRFIAGKLSIKGGAVEVRRLADGTVNVALLIEPLEKGAVREQIDQAATEAAAEGRPFQFMIKSVSFSGLQAALSDLTVQPDRPLLHLEEVSGEVSDVDGKSPMKCDLGFNVSEGGRIKASGTVDPSLPSVESEVQITDVELAPFQPYVGQAAAVEIQSGAFTTTGRLRHGLKGADAQTVYQGGFKVENLRLTETGQKETLVGWRTLQSDRLELQLEPDQLEVDEVRLVAPTGKFIIEKDRSFNLANVIKPGDKAQKPGPGTKTGSAGPFPYRLRRVLVSDGRADFADLSLITPFATKIHELKGSVAGVSSAEKARAQVKLDGRVDEYGTAKVGGEFKTSDPKDFTDINVTFRNVEMSKLSPYSGKFAGRKIESGKLSLDLTYKIVKSQLAGDNQIVVERLTLGEKVKSPEAVDLPLDLAVALLKDADGVIDLGLPVKGDISAPEFSFGALIRKALFNLITKIVTSPFRVLAALIPGGREETLNSVAFEPGQSELPAPEREKLANLATAMEKRPQLKLMVRGRYQPATDQAQLRMSRLRRELAVRLGQKPDPAEDPGPVDYSGPETLSALEAMFAERFGADSLKAVKADVQAEEEKAKKGETAKGRPVQASGGDPGRLARRLFKRLAEAQPVDEANLNKLADARAQAIVAELSRQGGIARERIGVRPPAVLDEKGSISAALSLEVM